MRSRTTLDTTRSRARRNSPYGHIRFLEPREAVTPDETLLVTVTVTPLVTPDVTGSALHETALRRVTGHGRERTACRQPESLSVPAHTLGGRARGGASAATSGALAVTVVRGSQLCATANSAQKATSHRPPETHPAATARSPRERAPLHPRARRAPSAALPPGRPRRESTRRHPPIAESSSPAAPRAITDQSRCSSASRRYSFRQRSFDQSFMA